jgi:RNA polymerase sigma-70 factor, ECF subfamily
MAAISHLIEAEIPSLRRYARSLLRNSSGIEDLVQDTLVRALEKAHLWQAGTNLRAWMFTMMHNQYVNYVRMSVRHGSEVRAETAGLTIGATQHVAIEFRDMKRALLSLPAEQRDVVQMVCIEGMAYEDVAKTLGVPIGTVRSRLSRARDAISSFVTDGPAKRNDVNAKRPPFYPPMHPKNDRKPRQVLDLAS